MGSLSSSCGLPTFPESDSQCLGHKFLEGRAHYRFREILFGWCKSEWMLSWQQVNICWRNEWVLCNLDIWEKKMSGEYETLSWTVSLRLTAFGRSGLRANWGKWPDWASSFQYNMHCSFSFIYCGIFQIIINLLSSEYSDASKGTKGCN